MKTRNLILLGAGLVVAFLVGHSSSQEVGHAAKEWKDGGETGRYVYVAMDKIFDTKTGRLWKGKFFKNAMQWSVQDAPWEQDVVSAEARR